MGTWGFNILDDDTARDVHADYMKHFNAGRDRAEIMRRLEESYEGTTDDEDEGPVFWIAVAKAQWDCGHLDESVQRRVESDIESGRGLERWAEEGPKPLAKREAKVRAFVERLREPNPKPRRPKPPIKRKPIFEAGDCIAVRLSDGSYGAALVLADREDDRGPDEETYGTNVVGQLRYKSPEKPGPEVFDRREWLRLTHHSWADSLFRDPSDPEPGVLWVVNVMRSRFGAVKERFEIVGRAVLRESDPAESRTYAGWNFADEIVAQDLWDRGSRP